MSNILDRVSGKESKRGTEAQGAHGDVIGATEIKVQLLLEVGKRVKAVTGIKAFLIFAMAALDLAVVARSVGPDELVADIHGQGSALKEGELSDQRRAKAVGKLGAVVGLNALNGETMFFVYARL